MYLRVSRLLRRRARFQAKYDETVRYVEHFGRMSFNQMNALPRWSGKIAVINERLRRDGFTQDGDIPLKLEE